MKIGLTGGIGSGKTTVAHIFETLGIPVYYADDAAKRIMNQDSTVKAALRKAFGENVYINDQLNRAYLAKVVFANSKQLSLLNQLVHPATLADAENWMSQQTASYSIKEAALLFESDAWKGLDKIIGVAAPIELRISRTMHRDQISREEVVARISNQMNQEEKMSRCDFIIQNDDNSLLIPQVLAIHQQILSIVSK
ncbi:MAG: dephospho-CoA kinase [Ferruginibacter sp.]